ncbi:MAG: hypothetical protein HQK50_01350 [Oligoflexia bacterium]|nr:hypothetical protein [Oligoflexia bacterium]MBF0364184.1 hypothetical protein [Oligoflexia bacterium]
MPDSSCSCHFANDHFESTPFKVAERRGQYYDIETILKSNPFECDHAFVNALEAYNLAYRTLCGILFNFVPKSGHPGGSISSGHFVNSLLFQTMDYDLANPERLDADHLVYAAGHKAMGLYATWALRNECVRIAAPELLPPSVKQQLRLEDLLGFRRNPTNEAPLFNKYHSKSLDGHPAPITPFVRLATGASGVGVTTAMGMAFAALDYYGDESAPFIHIVEGEAGLTPGRVHEVMSAAATAQLKNVIMHVDWNQASIDSNCVCREGSKSGDYVQWSPLDLAYIHDWNVLWVANGHDFHQVLAAQAFAKHLAKKNPSNRQPTAIVYRTVKGWRYGIEGRSAHGAGHEFCSPEFYKMLGTFEEHFKVQFPRFDGDKSLANVEQNFFDCLLTIRKVFEENKRELSAVLACKLIAAKERLNNKQRTPRADAPAIDLIYNDHTLTPENVPEELQLLPGKSTTLRGVLADCFGYLNRKSKGAIIGSSADLFGSTSVSNLALGCSEGYYNSEKNPKSRLVMVGGICEDAIGGFMSGLSAFSRHLGVGTSYGAFIAALQHVTARLHAIGQEAHRHVTGKECNPFVIVCAHAGPKTGEDGPTHADPQSLQLMSGNFPRGLAISFTPSEPTEIWPLLIAALKARPAVIIPYVSRPNETIIDRESLRLEPAHKAIKGVYALRKADSSVKTYHGSVVLQGNSVAEPFIHEVLPRLDKEGINMNIYYVASADLFDMLSLKEQEENFPAKHANEAMGITEFTMATMYRWITSPYGREHSIYSFKKGHYLGSGQAHKVLEEAGLNADGQYQAIIEYIKGLQ